jgi:hypothetical protein
MNSRKIQSILAEIFGRNWILDLRLIWTYKGHKGMDQIGGIILPGLEIYSINISSQCVFDKG